MSDSVHALYVFDEGGEDISIPFGGRRSTTVGDTFGDNSGEYFGVDDSGSGVWWDWEGFVMWWWWGVKFSEGFDDLFCWVKDFAVAEGFHCSADVSFAKELFGLCDIVWDVGLWVALCVMGLLDVCFKVDAVGVKLVIELFLDLLVELFGGLFDVPASRLVEDHSGDVHYHEESAFGSMWVISGVCCGEGLE